MPTAKKALIIIPYEDFEDKEFLHTKEELEKFEINTFIASSKKGTAKGVYGTKVKIDLKLSEANADQYDAIIFIGGLGTVQYYNDKKALSLVSDAFAKGKKVCAICVAPLIFAKAGILKDKHATVFSSNFANLSEMLEEGGAIYTGKQVEIDENVITANGPKAAREFGRLIGKELCKN